MIKLKYDISLIKQVKKLIGEDMGMNKRMKKKRRMLFLKKYKVNEYIKTEKMVAKAREEYTNIETEEAMKPIQKYFYKHFGKIPQEDEGYDLQMLRLLCSVNYARLEKYKKGELSNSDEIKKEESDKENLVLYYEELHKWGNEINKIASEVEELSTEEEMIAYIFG